MPIQRPLLLSLLLLGCAPALAAAQGPCREFQIQVRQAGTGAALPGASVRIHRPPRDSVVHAGTTDAQGTFRAAGGAVQPYLVAATAPGHVPGTGTVRCPSAGTGAVSITLVRVDDAADTTNAARWLVLARDERVEIGFDHSNTRRVGPSRHRVKIRWTFPQSRGGGDVDYFRYDRVVVQVEADCRARTWSYGDHTYYMGDRVVYTETGPWQPGNPFVPGSIGERAGVELCKYLTM